MGTHNWLVKYPEDLGSGRVDLQCTQCPARFSTRYTSYKRAGGAGPDFPELAAREGVLPTCEEERVREVMDS